MKTSICFVSSTRADYSLLLPSIKECLSRKSKGVKTSVIVTGSHTIKSQGETINHFKKDKIPISYSFKILDKTDSKGVKDNFKNPLMASLQHMKKSNLMWLCCWEIDMKFFVLLLLHI